VFLTLVFLKISGFVAGAIIPARLKLLHISQNIQDFHHILFESCEVIATIPNVRDNFILKLLREDSPINV